MLELRAEQALSESEERFRTLVNTSTDAIISTNSEGKIAMWNQGAENIFGYTAEEVQGRSLSLIMPEHLYENHEAGITRVITSRESKLAGETVELTGKRKDDTEFPVELSLSIWEVGQETFFTGIIRDISERKHIEDALQQSEKRFRSIFEGVDDAIFVESMKGEILDVNDRACEMFGWTHEEFVTKTVSDLVPVGQIAVIPEEMGEDIPEIPIETVNIRSNGEEFPVEITARLQTIGDEEVMLAVVRDITERKEAEEVLEGYRSELERSNESLEQFAYVASHDLQEPLRMISSFMELLSAQYAEQLDENAQEYIDFAVDGAQRMQRLVLNLLTFSRVGTRGKSFEKIECEDVLEISLTNLKVALEESAAVVTHDPLPVVMADEDQLAQLFQNLIGNAIKFIEEGPPKVHIGVSEGKGFHRFSIQDNGIGIAPENLERIFGASQRLHSIDEYPGTGLGLAICKKIVERHGGRIWVESEPGVGSTFYFTLPADV
jgi:PAS domain S-box-containing protein